MTYFGTDNQIDGIVIDVLINKHKRIRNSLGVSVPVPVDTNQVIEAIFEGLLLKEQQGRSAEEQMILFEDYFKPKREDLHKKWDSVVEREKRSRTMFAQEGLEKHVAEVKHEVEAIHSAIGSDEDVERFVTMACRINGGIVSGTTPKTFDFREAPRALKDLLGEGFHVFKGRFSYPVNDDEVYLARTQPVVEHLSSYVLEAAFDNLIDGKAKRAGVIRSSAIKMRTSLLILRLRYHIITRQFDREEELLAEDCLLAAFEGSAKNATWLQQDKAEALLSIESDANVSKDIAQSQLQKVLDDIESVNPELERLASSHGEKILQAHKQVREAAQIKHISYRIEPKLPADILGIYLYLPAQ